MCAGVGIKKRHYNHDIQGAITALPYLTEDAVNCEMNSPPNVLTFWNEQSIHLRT